MARYRDEDSVLAMFNRFFHLCETKEQKTLVLDMKQAFLEIIPSDATPKSEWISVDERLPKETERVLVYGENGICIAVRYKDDWFMSTRYDGEITRWKPLPEPPKGE